MVRKLLRPAIFSLILLTLTLTPQTSLAQEGDVITEQKMRTLFDFLITLELSELPDYLKHRNSKQNPVTKVRVTYRLLPKPGKIRPCTDEINYEEIYYEKSVPIGTRELHELGLLIGEQGCIKVLDSPTLGEHPEVMTNAIVRV